MFDQVPYACWVILNSFSTGTQNLLVVLTLMRQYFQLKRCVLDGLKIVPSNHFRGIRNYFGSPANQIDLMLSGAMILDSVAWIFRRAEGYHVVLERLLDTNVAVAVLLMYAKVKSVLVLRNDW